jgi:hypothetical protein
VPGLNPFLALLRLLAGGAVEILLVMGQMVDPVVALELQAAKLVARAQLGRVLLEQTLLVEITVLGAVVELDQLVLQVVLEWQVL